MKAFAIPAAALAATFALVQPAAAADITLKPPPGLPGPEIRITAPGVPGRIDLGRLPQPPAVILPQPVVIQAPRVVAPQPPQPVYLWVPPGHRKDW
ncbi:MAG TPA: hypothetical protein VFR86_28785, partial [Burkholderiaceae bacterium]|nr:hypothetical protein [Burkholderiaceae bacterium]